LRPKEPTLVRNFGMSSLMTETIITVATRYKRKTTTGTY